MFQWEAIPLINSQSSLAKCIREGEDINLFLKIYNQIERISFIRMSVKFRAEFGRTVGLFLDTFSVVWFVLEFIIIYLIFILPHSVQMGYLKEDRRGHYSL